VALARMKLALAALAASSALALLAPGLASGCTVTSSPATITVSEAGYTLYVIHGCQYCGPQALFVYYESNGIAGLQREDPAVDDTCGGLWPADSEIY
jgi:hypothetical protein